MPYDVVLASPFAIKYLVTLEVVEAQTDHVKFFVRFKDWEWFATRVVLIPLKLIPFVPHTPVVNVAFDITAMLSPNQSYAEVDEGSSSKCHKATGTSGDDVPKADFSVCP